MSKKTFLIILLVLTNILIMYGPQNKLCKIAFCMLLNYSK